MPNSVQDSQMLKEAAEAPERIRKLLDSDAVTYSTLGRRLRELNPACVATVARGSSDHAANYASYLIPLCSGKVVASISPSVITVLNAPLDLNRQFVLAVSQSGRSPDIIATVDSAKKSGAFTAAIINDIESPVATMADVLLPQHAGPEGIAATKTVLATLVSVARLTAEWMEDQKLLRALAGLPEVLETCFQSGLGLDANLLKGISNVYVLSRGLGLCAALELSLKLKETCGIHAEAFSSAEVRHGPREIVDGNFMVIALALQQSGQDDVIAAARELESQGARLILIDKIPATVDWRLAPIATLQMLYPWLARSSKSLGHDPDRPRTLKSKVVKTT